MHLHSLRKLKIEIFFLILIAGGCSTTSTEQLSSPTGAPVAIVSPPDEALDFKLFLSGNKDKVSIENLLVSRLPASPTQVQKWWTDYIRAQLWQKDNSKLSCTLFTGLAQEKLFPLFEIAQYHADQTCDYSIQKKNTSLKF